MRPVKDKNEAILWKTENREQLQSYGKDKKGNKWRFTKVKKKNHNEENIIEAIRYLKKNKAFGTEQINEDGADYAKR